MQGSVRPTGGTAIVLPLRSWKDVYLQALASMSPGVLAGLVCGAVIGGIGGRLAMFALRLTSSDALHGAETDDGFTIGSFTSESFFLIAATMLLGMLGGLVYMGVRQWLPRPFGPALYALLGVTAGGTVIINPDGIDFTVLDPLGLAVAMFLALLALYGAAVSVLADRLDALPGLKRSFWRWAGALPLLTVALGGPGVIIFASFFIIGAFNRRGAVTSFWSSPPVTWLGRVAFIAAASATAFLLAKDIGEVL